MGSIALPAVDDARAKTMARAIQRRYRELGNEVSLNHAYEALAAAHGFETWTRMKARLDAPEHSTPPDPALALRRKADIEKSKLRFADLVPGDLNPCVLVTGSRSGLAGMAMTALMRDWRGLSTEPRGVRIVSTAPHIASAAASVRAADAPGGMPAFGSGKGQRINIFDTPLGERRPSPKHRNRLVEFLRFLIEGDDGKIAGTTQLAGAAVDTAYDFASDRSGKGKPAIFDRGGDKRVLAWLETSGRTFKDFMNWWDVSDHLIGLDLRGLAACAQAQAVPRLDTLMRVLRDPAVMDIYGSARTPDGELLVDCAMRRISSAIREYAIFQRPSTEGLDFDAETLEVRLDGETDDPRLRVILQHVAVDACLKGRHFDRLADSAQARGIVSFENVERFLADSDEGPIFDLIERSYKGGPHVIASTGDPVAVASLSQLFPTHVVTGATTRADVVPVCRSIGLDDDAVGNVHDYLFDLAAQAEAPVAVCLRKGFRSVSRGLVEIPRPKGRDGNPQDADGGQPAKAA